MKAVQRHYEWGILIYIAGRYFALHTVDPDSDGKLGGHWGLIHICDRFVPPVEPLPRLGFCLETGLEYPDEPKWYEGRFIENDTSYSISDDQDRAIQLDKLSRAWWANW
jgi:hypothetical protein